MRTQVLQRSQLVLKKMPRVARATARARIMPKTPEEVAETTDGRTQCVSSAARPATYIEVFEITASHGTSQKISRQRARKMQRSNRRPHAAKAEKAMAVVVVVAGRLDLVVQLLLRAMR